MDFENYKLLKIPFCSKKKSFEILGVGKKSKYSFSGIAYYLIDLRSYCVVWERAVIKETEYRPTDNPMLITSHYNTYYLTKGIDRESIFPFSNTEYDLKIADQIIIDRINQYSLDHTKTVLSIEGVISGSNPTGSDSKIVNSPICIDPRFDNEYIRFVNAIKRIRCHDKLLNQALKEVLNEVSDIEKIFNKEITISELINSNLMFGKWMKIINSDIDELTDSDSDILEYVDQLNQKEIRDSVWHVISMYEKNLLDKDKLISKLRKEFRVSLIREAIENGYSEYAGDSELDILDTEAAHILGVSEIKNNNLDLEWIANPNNGLLLSPKLHTILDKNKVHLDESGLFTPVDDKYEGKLKKYKLNDEILNEERIKFINLRNKYQ